MHGAAREGVGSSSDRVGIRRGAGRGGYVVNLFGNVAGYGAGGDR